MLRRVIFPVIMAFLLAALGIFFFQRRTIPANSFSFAALNPLRLFAANAPAPPLESGSWPTYANSDYGFSFSYPQGFTVSAFPEGEGDTVLVQRIVGAGAEVQPPKIGGSTSENLGFQIYITPFDEPGPITPERIRQDLPDMIIAQAKEIEIAGARMLAFLSSDAPNRTREVWFVNGPNLYQITASADFDQLLSEILLTWKFQ